MRIYISAVFEIFLLYRMALRREGNKRKREKNTVRKSFRNIIPFDK